MARPRATKANFLAALLALLLGFAIATQVHQTQSSNLETLREDDLVRLLDQVQQGTAGSATRSRSSRPNATSCRAESPGPRQRGPPPRNGWTPSASSPGRSAAHGPGITITIRDPKGGVTAPLLLDALEELRDAGAEAVAYDDVRVVAGTYFTDDDKGGISADGRPLTLPYTITAIGDAATLASAMDIPGGVSDSVRRVGASIDVTTSANLAINALHSIQVPRYARPVSEATPTSS